jgi:hypothetical protein
LAFSNNAIKLFLRCDKLVCFSAAENFVHSLLFLVRIERHDTRSNGATHFKYVNNCLNTNIYSYLEMCVCQSSNLHLNVDYFFNASVN